MSVTVVGGMDLEKLRLTAEDILIVRGGLDSTQLVLLRDKVTETYGFTVLVVQFHNDEALETMPRADALRILRAIVGPDPKGEP